MRSTLLRPGEPFRRPSVVDPLPKYAEVSVAIGLENYPAAIRGPDRETIVACIRQAAHRFIAGGVEEPDHSRFISQAFNIRSKGNTLTIGRNAGRLEKTNRYLETFH